MIPDALAFLATPVDELAPHPRNVRRGDLATIAASLESFGQVRPIVATVDGTIVAGNHVYAAARTLGWTDVAAVRVELDEATALRYLLADNRASDRGGYDDSALAELLEHMMGDGLLFGTGYSPDDVDDLRAQVDAIADSVIAGADYAESPEETAGRRPPPEEFDPMREVVVLLDAAAFEVFAGQVRDLKRAWGIEATRDVVRAAVELAHEHATGRETTDA